MTDATTESKKVIRRTLPQPPQEIESALLSPVRSISDVSHVQCIAQVNNQVLIRVYCLNVHSLDVHWYLSVSPNPCFSLH